MAEVHRKKAAGVIFVKVDGNMITAKGAFTYKLSGEKREYDMSADGSGYFTSKAKKGGIKGVIINLSEVDHEELENAEGVTVTLELGNGKVISAKDAVQVDEMEGNSETGEIPIEWESDSVQEIK